ncbi:MULTISPECIES: hypothetical protein [Microbacterium]|jgi:hypothetical protein|uniref:Uncharacterized protein n=1 Tax=Microbacterium paraoxydans TaxID=199592 RepID=A0A1H1MD50_9MICO|nr:MULTISPECIES: hypothetical protein [Microbacterium]MCK2031781.1 hypothetical protein [Microbacterium sp. KSW4-4]MCT2225741.1 hypothetical protein [Microbacterium paraoxydans]QXE28483.1 hypothetical protein IZR02_08635 [Microbacterium paraoxydans]SDR83889.1 hypothetical protein SAMN04489809_0458 [Microbacterium paraoxydans]
MNGRENIPADDVSAQDPLAGDGSGDPNSDRQFLQDLPPAQVDTEQQQEHQAEADDEE